MLRAQQGVPGVRRATFRRPAAVALALAAGLAVTACGSDDDSGGSKGGDGAEALSAQEIVAKVQPAMVSIITIPPGETREPADNGRHAHGTGVIYDAKRGLVLTSNHYLEGARSIRVTVNGKTTVRGRPVARAQCKDFAVLELRPRPSDLTQVTFGNSDKILAGEKISALGYLQPPGQKKASLIKTDGSVSSTGVSSEIHEALPPLPSVILHQAPLQLAMSGGPLVNEQGELVGLDTMLKDGTVGPSGPWPAVTGNWLRDWLRELRPGKGSTYVGWKSEHRCHGALAGLSAEAMGSHTPGQHSAS